MVGRPHTHQISRMKEHGMSLGLAQFFSNQENQTGIHPATHPASASSSHHLHHALEDLDISSPLLPPPNTALLTLHHIQNSPCSTPPISPPNAFSALYPLPPHLTPLPSPNQSRPPSPSNNLDEPGHHEHVLHSTNLLGKITVRVVEARGLGVSTFLEKP